MRHRTHPTPAQRQAQHALTAFTRTTPDRRRRIAAAAETYLDQVDRRRLPVGYTHAIHNDAQNRADAYRMRGGDTLTRLLGLAAHPTDPNLPATARAILATANAPIRELVAQATLTGQPVLVAVAHIAVGGRRG